VQTDVFSIDVPPDSYWQLPRAGGLHPTGKDNRVVLAAGALVLLFPPLPVGTHVFSFLGEGIENGQPWKTTRTITIRVQKPNVPLP
jgi:hypothetical protein